MSPNNPSIDYVFYKRKLNDDDANIEAEQNITCGKRIADSSKRFENVVVPVGLPLYQNNMDMDRNDSDSNEVQVVENSLFDRLFFSVGKHLGSSRSTFSTSKKNKTNKIKKHKL